MLEDLYCVHGVGVRLCTDSAAIAASGRLFLRHFDRESLPGGAPVELVFRGVSRRAEIPVTLSPSAEALPAQFPETAADKLPSKWEYDLYQDDGQIVIDFHQQGLMRIDGRQDRAEGYLIDPDAMHPEARVSFMHLALTELLKRRGLYTIHAAALERNGRGVLIPGASGRGKTTCCISLLRAGYRCLSDDHPLFRENGSGLELLPFPVKIDVTEKTISLFPELVEANGRLHQGLQKRYFYLEDLFPQATAGACEPALLLFPQIIDWPESRLEPLSKSRAVEELLRHGLLMLDREVARKQFHSLFRLVETTACYRLYFGEGVLDLPRLIDPLLEPG